MTRHILISGTGQLGSRYLQGLVSCTTQLHIHAHDVASSSLIQARQRWDEVTKPNSPHSIDFHTSLDGLPAHIDVAIVASTAHQRPELVAVISKHTQVSAWILEKVLAQSEEGLTKISEAVGHSAAWVNTPRRMLPWHQQIKKHLAPGRPKHLVVSGGAWGLACNSVHFLDMFAWWTGERLTSIDTSSLNAQWQESKRAGNFEVMGTLRAVFSGGSTARLSAQEGEVFYSFAFDDGDDHWTMDEAAGTAVRSDGLLVPGRLPFQSEVSGALVESILAGKGCELPTLHDSISMHKPYLSELLTHWQKHMDDTATAVPIT